MYFAYRYSVSFIVILVSKGRFPEKRAGPDRGGAMRTADMSFPVDLGSSCAGDETMKGRNRAFLSEKYTFHCIHIP
jgi:hypothetical protein